MTKAPWAAHLPPGSGDPDLLEEGTLPAAWLRRWERDAAKPILFDGRWVGSAELAATAERVAGRLRHAGLVPGDRIIVSAGASAALVAAHIGALRAGLVVVPVNGAYREREVAYIVRDCEPAAAIVDDRERGAWVTAASERDVVVTGPAVELPYKAAPKDLPAAGDPALLCYTSGTTGTPKGAVLSHANVLAGVASVAIAWRWTSADRLLLALPLFHVHGLGVGLHGTLLAGASAVLYPRFDADDVLAGVREHDATLFFGVPTMYARLAASSAAGRLRTLRLCVSGSAPLPPDLFARIEDAAGQRILERYGMTETLMNVSNPYDGERRAGTVGFPLPGVELRLAEGSGEIQLRGPNVFDGYWQNPDATAATFEPEGWLKTGDVGELDGDGYLRIVGRSKELIISGGFNVYPREVEEVLRAHPSVRDVAVVGTPSEEWGETVTAFVVPDGTLDEAALLEFAAGQLAPYKRPRIVRVVDDLPRNALGKVLRQDLR